MMESYWIAYRNVEDSDKQGFELMPQPGPQTRIVRAAVLPGLGSLKPVHIQWHHADVDGMSLHLVTYTHSAVSERRADGLLRQAAKFIRQRQ